MNEGLQAFHDNQTWEVPCLSGVKSIGCKLVYIMKVESDGSFDRYKARLVELGYNLVSLSQHKCTKDLIEMACQLIHQCS